MKKVTLSHDEKEIAEAIERDEFVPVTGKELQEAADSISNLSL